MNPTPEMLDDAATLWRAADLEFLCREGAQLRLYNWLDSQAEENPESVSPFVLKCHRRMGKSFMTLLRRVRRCLKYPGQRCVFGAPTYEQVEAIAIPNLAIILQTKPVDIGYRRSGSSHYFFNPVWGPGAQESCLDIVGVNYRKGDLLRGAFADEVTIDECRECEHLKHVVEHVLIYQFAGRKFPVLELISTMPATPDHEFEQYFVPEANRRGRYVSVPTTDNPGWTQRDDNMLANSIVGGRESISWKREALCESLADEEDLIIPEFALLEKSKGYAKSFGPLVVDSWQRPTHWFPETCLDTGWNDWNAAVFGYVDFPKAVLVIEDELVVRYKSTGEIAQKIFEKEKQLWATGNAGQKNEPTNWLGSFRPRRIGDLTDQAREDLFQDHKLSIMQAEKWDRTEAINSLRTTIIEGKLKIHSRCKQLLYQLRSGIWNKNRTQFERSKTIGHCDALAALVYLHRHARWRNNPIPVSHTWSPDVMETRTRKKLKGKDNFIECFGG